MHWAFQVCSCLPWTLVFLKTTWGARLHSFQVLTAGKSSPTLDMGPRLEKAFQVDGDECWSSQSDLLTPIVSTHRP